MLFRFVGFTYTKSILLVFLALEFFFVSIDTLKYINSLPDSANLLVLFFVYEFLNALNYTFPISIMLASITAYITLIKSNQLVAILSIGYSKKQILKVILLIATVLNALYIALNATPFVYSQENINNIIQRASISDAKNDILVKYENSYVYINKIYPLLQKAELVKIFETKNLELKKFIQAKEAIFDGEYWILKEATINNIPDNLKFGKSKIEIVKMDEYKTLRGFKPKVLDTVYQNKPNASIIDAFNAFLLLKEQNLNTQKIRSLLYSFAIIPLTMVLSIIIISYYMPLLGRYTNLAKLAFSLTLVALILWGMFFALTKLSISGFFHPELGTIIPISILGITSIFYYKRK